MPLFPQETSIAKLKVSELVAIDLAASEVKLLRAKKGKDGVSITGIGTMPSADLFEEDSGDDNLGRLVVPKQWMCNYAAICLTGENSIIRYVSLPGQVAPSEAVNKQLSEHMGLEEDCRLSYVIVDQPKKRTETRLLAAALPDADAEALLSRAQTGTPAPVSLEVASLASLNTFHTYGPVSPGTEEAVGFIECGAAITLLALFDKGSLILVRKFNTGGNLLLARVQEQLGVDSAVAEGIITDGSFDISQSVQDVMEPFLRQLSISKDFVERREACQIGKIYVGGGMSLCSYWVDCVRKAVGSQVEVWDPFANVSVADGAIPEELEGQKARFGAALGAALGVFEEA